jgi:hypothetical protein
MGSRQRGVVVPCHGRWHELQPGGQAEAIVVDLWGVGTGLFFKGSSKYYWYCFAESENKALSCRVVEYQHLVGH